MNKRKKRDQFIEFRYQKIVVMNKAYLNGK